jgi:hypothetical protein
MDGHLADLLLHLRPVSGIAVLLNKGAALTLRVLAAIPLFTDRGQPCLITAMSSQSEQ